MQASEASNRPSAFSIVWRCGYGIVGRILCLVIPVTQGRDLLNLFIYKQCYRQWFRWPPTAMRYRVRGHGMFSTLFATTKVLRLGVAQGHANRVASGLFLTVLLCCNPVLAASLPDVSKPGGAQAGRQFKAPVPPNMRRFLAKPEAELPPSQKPDDSRISVQSIQLDGVVERLEHDIIIAELTAFVEEKRQALIADQDSGHPRGTGGKLSFEERKKLLRQIESLAKDEDADNTLDELEQTIQQYRQQPGASSVLTLHQLQEIAAHVAQYYRARGFVLVRAVIPPQTIKDGRVHIRVLEGILGNVNIEKNHKYTREQMLRPFREVLGQPVTKNSIEEAMLLLNDYPGLKTFGVFQPGLLPGETSLLVSVLEEDYTNANVHVDNYGSKFTGEYRARLDMVWNNPLNAIDQLRASLSKTYEPHNGTYGSLFYERHAFGPKNTFGIGASKNIYSLGSYLEPFGISGTTILAQTYWRRAFHRGRLFNSYGLFQLSRKSAKLKVTEGDDRADEITVFSIESGFDWSSASRRHQASAKLQYSKGYEGLFGAMEATFDPDQTDASRRGGSGIYAGSDFSKANIDYDHWYRFMPNHMLHVSFRSQFSEDLLTSLEQMPIGGPNSVRAYSTAESLRDKALAGSIEWLIKAPGFSQWKAFGNKRWGELFQVSLFADYAKGWLNDPLASDREVVSLSGIGAGFRFNYEQFSARFEFASPLGDGPSGNDRDPQYFFELNVGF